MRKKVEIKNIPVQWLKTCKASDLTCQELTENDKPYVYDIILLLIDEYEEYVRFNNTETEPIKCKDCKYLNANEFSYICDLYTETEDRFFITKLDGYCHRAERKKQ